MAKRQERLHGREMIKAQIGSLKGTKVTLVLKDKTAFFVEVGTMEGSTLKVRDMRLQKLDFELADIEEVIIDKTTV